MLTSQLKCFFAVARLGSVTLAAKQLSLSQPTVTTQIRALEAHYGVELFRRSGGRLAISDAGVRLLPQVEQLLQHEINVEFALRHASDLHRGQLRLGATAPYYMLELVQRYRARHPQVEISIAAGNSRQMIDALLEYRVDLVTSSRVETDDRLHRVQLGADPLVLVVQREHRLAARAEVTPADLAGEPLLLRERGSTTRELGEQLLAEAGVQPASTLEIASREALREAIARGLGISIVARHETGEHPELRVVPFAGDAPVLAEYLYCLKERRQSRLIEAFLGITAELRQDA